MEPVIENPYESIVYFPDAIKKYAVTEGKLPHRRVLAMFDTLESALAARDAVAKANLGRRQRSYEKAAL